MKKISFFILITAVIFASCKKKGYVEINYLDYYIKNCTAPYSVEFYMDISYQPKEISVTWDFGDGETSNDLQPVHVYQEPGTYTVKINIVNYKTVVEETMVIDVSEDPMPIISEFNYKTLHGNYYAPSEIKFYNKSQYSTNFFWNFGDGYGSAEDSPTHIFDSAGTYNVTLNAMCSGDTASSTAQITIQSPPDDIYIDVVSIWLPDMYLGALFNLYYYTDIHNETPIDLPTASADDYPFGWVINDELFFFDGDYNDDHLYFEIWEVNNNQAPTYNFGISFNEIQQSFYPDTLWWDSGTGYAAEVLISYE